MKNKLKQLLRDIEIIKEGETKTLDVKITPHYAMWEPNEDEGWLNFKKAKENVPQWIQNLLEFVGYYKTFKIK